MATTTIKVPEYAYSGFYYPDLVRRLRIFGRANAPEITSEVQEEPFVQAEQAFALVGHLCNVLLDLAACELLLPTCQLQDSARLLLRLVDYALADYSPATVELLLRLAQFPTAAVRILDEHATFATRRTEDVDAVTFERIAALDAGPANVVDGAFGLEFDRTGSDGATVLGDPDAFASASMAVTSADVGREIEVVGGVLGNAGTFRVAEVLASGATSRVRLEAVLGGETPLFIPETGLTWTLRAYTANGATAVNAAGLPTWTPWTVVHAGDKLYLGSRYVMWDEFRLTLATPGAGITGVWEYFDPTLSSTRPDDVENTGTALRLELTSLLGATDLRGALVRVTHLASGVSELLASTWSGSLNQVTTSAFLGQSGTPSTLPTDYEVACDWVPLPGATDATANLSTDGKVSGYTLPQTLLRNWTAVEVAGVSGWFVRFRVVGVAGPVAPVIDEVDLDTGTAYALVEATQGEPVLNEPVVSSNGTADQTFALSLRPGLRDAVACFVDEGGLEVEWTNLTTEGRGLLTSGSRDRHFVVDQDATGVLTARFGNGVRGRIPPLGVDNVRFEYRVGATADGNVGAGTVTVNATGAAWVAEVTNPRAAWGWREAEGASPESLALVKETGPASLRTGNRAVSPTDYETLATRWVSSTGTRPVVRAKAVEEGYGPKTIKLVVVGTNGVALPNSIKEELEVYFNGSEEEGVEGVGMANYEVTVVNFTPRVLAFSVRVEANAALSKAMVATRLATLLNPTAREADGTRFTWRFGGRVPMSRVGSEVFNLSPGNVFDVDVSLPAADVELLDEELPLLDTATLDVSVVEVAS